MIVGLYQCPSPGGDVEAGLNVLDQALAAAKGASVDMLVMPEAFLPGYAAVSAAPSLDFDATKNRVAALCKTHGLALTIGLAEHTDSKVFNAAVAFDRSGAVLAQYRKIQLFSDREAATYTAGDRYCTFDFEGKRFGLLICYDVEFPEHCRALKRQGAEVILVPTANMMPFVNVNQIIVPSRAAENALTVVYANYCGAEGDLDYVGLSGIYGPDGYLLAGKGTNPGLCVAELPGAWSEHGIPNSTQVADLKIP